MINIILFIIIVLAIMFISIMYLQSIQVHTAEAKYNIVMRFLIVCLLTIMFLENTSQTEMLKGVSGSIKTYLSDAGKTMIDFIDKRTSEINIKLNGIDEKISSVDEHISTINKNINDTKSLINIKTNVLIEFIKRYSDQKIEEIISSITPLGPGGMKTIW